MTRKTGTIAAANSTPSAGQAALEGFAGMMASFDDHMEAKYPGHRAREREKTIARERVKEGRRIAIAERLGSAEAIVERTPQEKALLAAIEPFVDEWRTWSMSDGTEHRYAASVASLDVHEIGHRATKLPEEIRTAVISAIPMPGDLVGLLAEARAWHELARDRTAVLGSDWDQYLEVEIRVGIVEDALDASMPATSWADVLARLEWKRWEEERGWLDPTEREDPFLDRLEADIRRLMPAGEFGVSSAR